MINSGEKPINQYLENYSESPNSAVRGYEDEERTRDTPLCEIYRCSLGGKKSMG